MTETSGYNDPGSYDAATVSAANARIIKRGYQEGYLNSLLVYENTPTAMNVLVATGGCWIEGTWHKNDAVKTLTIDASSPTLNRIDLIVARRTGTTSIVLAVLKGTAGASPSPPTLTKTLSVYEITLAQVTINATVTAITNAMITDKRLSTDCGPAACEYGFFTIDPATGNMVNAGKNIVMGTGYITGLHDPVAAQDAATKASSEAAATAAAASVSVSVINPYGNGSDGAKLVNSNQSISGLKQYTSLQIDNTYTLTCTANTVILCTGTVTINGTINGDGANAGGAGGSASNNAVVGTSMGAGTALYCVGGTAGNGTSVAYSTGNGGNGGTLVAAYPCWGAQMLTALFSNGYYGAAFAVQLALVNSRFGQGGGGGGASGENINYHIGGTGGGGGAIIVIVAPTIVFNTGKYIYSRGAVGGNGSSGSYNGGSGGGGGGSGGLVLLYGKTITNNGTITVTAGSGGTGASYGTGSSTNGAAGSAGYSAVITLPPG